MKLRIAPVQSEKPGRTDFVTTIDVSNPSPARLPLILTRDFHFSTDSEMGQRDVEESHDFGKQLEFAGSFVTTMIALPFAVRVVVELGVPGIMAEAGPDAQLTAEDIALRLAAPNADAQMLDSLLRLLASQKVVTEVVSATPKDPNVVERRFGTTPLMKCLAVGLVNSAVRLVTSPEYTAGMHHIHSAVLDQKSRELSFRPWKGDVRVHGGGLSTPDFDDVMVDGTKNIIPPLLQAFRGFEGLSSLVYVGGGVCESLAQVLPKYPHLRGINFDQPHVVAKGLQVPRLEHVGGDFFESVPEGDAVWMKWVLHDWSDEDCVKILKNVYKALPPHGKVINLNLLLPEVSDSSASTQGRLAGDILMMSYTWWKRAQSEPVPEDCS